MYSIVKYKHFWQSCIVFIQYHQPLVSLGCVVCVLEIEPRASRMHVRSHGATSPVFFIHYLWTPLNKPSSQ